jgi:hypothetical protein
MKASFGLGGGGGGGGGTSGGAGFGSGGTGFGFGFGSGGFFAFSSCAICSAGFTSGSGGISIIKTPGQLTLLSVQESNSRTIGLPHALTVKQALVGFTSPLTFPDFTPQAVPGSSPVHVGCLLSRVYTGLPLNLTVGHTPTLQLKFWQTI